MISARRKSCSELGVQVGEEGRLPGQGDLERPVPQRGLHRREGAHRRLLVALQPDQDQGRLAIPGDEPVPGLRGRGDHRDHAFHLGTAGDLLQQLEEARLEHRVGRRQRWVTEQGDDAGVGIGTGGTTDERGGLGGLGALDRPAGQRPSANERDDRQGQQAEGAGEDEGTVPGDEPGERDEHEGRCSADSCVPGNPTGGGGVPPPANGERPTSPGGGSRSTTTAWVKVTSRLRLVDRPDPEVQQQHQLLGEHQQAVRHRRGPAGLAVALRGRCELRQLGVGWRQRLRQRWLGRVSRRRRSLTPRG